MKWSHIWCGQPQSIKSQLERVWLTALSSSRPLRTSRANKTVVTLSATLPLFSSKTPNTIPAGCPNEGEQLIKDEFYSKFEEKTGLKFVNSGVIQTIGVPYFNSLSLGLIAGHVRS